MTEADLSYRPVWLTSFWGFDPDRWGFIGFTEERDRTAFLRKASGECLVAIYVTKGPPSSIALRGKLVGVLLATTETGLDRDYMPGDAFAAKEADADRRKKWRFGVRVSRAWRLTDSEMPLIDDFAPRTIASDNPQNIGARGVRFVEPEGAQIFDLKLFEVPVYKGRRTINPNVMTLSEALRASRAVPRATTPYTVDELDGPKKLYILRLRGDIASFLGRSKRDVENKEIIKVGYSMDPAVRCYAFNKSMPKCAYSWEILKQDIGPAPYPSWKVAEAGENEMKYRLEELKAECLGMEFFLAETSAVEQVWQAGRRAARDALGS